ncbi:DUF2989 domain-containing protein [Vibrio salinus]|uniref:DUF2989 domain-containing protein n=1 Tax=Vibrio salinus TaxID=2899784 RepID=UPI001E64D3A6|nr:DUF2989 domain-containing protein [Vibrio salinus]MCE0492919.1 DUF2989 domain-containing protein [Vibrio salinus]
MKIKSLVVMTVAAGLLSGCFEDRRNTEQVCADHPLLKCEELNMDDGQCRIPRTNLIWHRLDVIKKPTDLSKIKEYKLTQAYKKCLEVAAQIQPIEQAELKRRRFNALVNSGANLKRLENELKKYKTPRSLYFLWSQIGDLDSRRRFLQLEGTKELETPYLQYALATFYIDRDPEKTVKFLNHSLELTHSSKNLNLQVIESLASLYNLMKEKEKSYIWAKVSKEFGAAVADDKQLFLLYGFDEKRKDQLDVIAEQVIDAINDGEFHSTLIPKNLN